MCKMVVSFPLVFVWAFIVMGVTLGIHTSVARRADAASNLHSMTYLDRGTDFVNERVPTAKEPEFDRPDNTGAYFSALFASNYKEMEIVARSHVARAEKAKDNFKKAQFLNLLGTAVYCQDRSLEAEKYYSEALAIFNAMKKDDYFFRAAPNLANVYFSLGCRADAELVLRACLKHYKATNNVDEYTGNLQTMAFNYSYSDEFKKATECYKEIIEIAKKHGKGDAFVADVLGEMASNYRRAKEPIKAQESLANALKLNPKLETSELAFFLLAQGKQEEARALTERELEKLEKKNHKHGWEYAVYLEAKAMVRLAMKDIGNCEALLLECARNRKENLGPTHPAFVQALRTLATHYEQSGQHMKAKALLLQVTEMADRSQKLQKKEFLKVILGK